MEDTNAVLLGLKADSTRLITHIWISDRLFLMPEESAGHRSRRDNYDIPGYWDTLKAADAGRFSV